MALKVLVSGDVEGNFDELFKRVTSVNKKNGPFEMLLCVGNYFGTNNDGWKNYTTGATKKVPITTYILGPNMKDHVILYPEGLSGDLCDNLACFGKIGLLTGSSGLRIAYVSGNEGKVSSETEFSYDEIDTFTMGITHESGFQGVDILLTSQWPKLVTNYAPNVPFDREVLGSEFLSEIAIRLKPRYHFAASENIYYERQPYRNHKVLAEGAKQVTRFIALSKVGNTTKQKWLYAFSITPMAKMDKKELIKQPDIVTECPYLVMPKIKTKKNDENSQQFFYDLKSTSEMNPQNTHKRRGDFSRNERDTKIPRNAVPSDSCWFCLSSPRVEKHLVITVGVHIYLALPKGGLVPEHVLILPIGHCQSTIDGLDDDASDELNRFKDALKKFFKSRGKTVVFFERNYKCHHLQIQAIPLPADKESILKQIFIDIAESQSIALKEVPTFTDLKQIVQPGVPYFYVELPSGEKLFHRIHKYFPIQFGREVLGSPPLLNVPDRVDWRDCPSSKEEEVKLVNQIRTAFQPFDFT